MNIKVTAFVFLLLATITADSVFAAKPKDEAIQCAKTWLAIVDAGRYAESWDATGHYLQRGVPREALERQLDGIHKRLGDVRSRKLKSAKFSKTALEVPGGDYFKVKFTTTFANKEAVETVTPVLQPDGTWKVCGYYVE